jgi:hypothetical protein
MLEVVAVAPATPAALPAQAERVVEGITALMEQPTLVVVVAEAQLTGSQMVVRV